MKVKTMTLITALLFAFAALAQKPSVPFPSPAPVTKASPAVAADATLSAAREIVLLKQQVLDLRYRKELADFNGRQDVSQMRADFQSLATKIQELNDKLFKAAGLKAEEFDLLDDASKCPEGTTPCFVKKTPPAAPPSPPATPAAN